MTARRRVWRCALLLGLAACQPTASDELAEVTKRLQASEDRLAAVELELEAMQTKLEALRAESVARPTPVPDVTRPELVSPEVAEGIECEGVGTANIGCKLDRARTASLLDSPAELAKQARIVPSVKDGKTRGFKLYAIRPGSLPKLVGLVNGDTITSLNGKPLDSLEVGLDVYEGSRKGEQLVIGIERRGSRSC